MLRRPLKPAHHLTDCTMKICTVTTCICLHAIKSTRLPMHPTSAALRYPCHLGAPPFPNLEPVAPAPFRDTGNRSTEARRGPCQRGGATTFESQGDKTQGSNAQPGTSAGQYLGGNITWVWAKWQNYCPGAMLQRFGIEIHSQRSRHRQMPEWPPSSLSPPCKSICV